MVPLVREKESRAMRNISEKVLMRKIICLSIIALAIISGGAALHAADSPLISELAAFRVVINNDGHEILAPAAEAKPGDIIEYHCTYTNVGASTLKNIKATLPIPPGLAYVEDSAQPHRFLASLNGKRFKQPPLYKTVTDASGKTSRVKVKPDEYKFIQWYIGRLAQGDARIVKARAMISKP